ncbi:MAG: Formate dehydrogenase, nitrate-inducible, iron-sulfur subunit [Anaerolineae bacterium]|nr:Formate dehydrogenase, nitrate-inducible, iron-sulfur subunit [Anaerolineae bacterium]
MNTAHITRRDFLKWSGASALALAAIPAFDNVALADFLGSEKAAEQFGILIDTTKCIGCRQCQVACQQKNNLPPLPEKLPAQETYPAQLSADAFTHIEFYKTGGAADAPVFTSIKRQCMHCIEPACAAVCPVGALVKTPQGPVTYDAEKCLGCRYCMAACPFNVPKFEWASSNPRIRKCDMCADRIAQGELPACVGACPTGALTFGARQALITQAQTRIRNNPDQYVPYIYGLSQVGGAGILYLANVPFDQIGLNMNLPETPAPEYTIQVMEKVPGIAIGVALLAGGVAWWRKRHAPAKNTAPESEDARA